MTETTTKLVKRIHDTPGKLVLAVSGGGSRAIAALLEVPGATRTVLEAVVPYSAEAMAQWLGGPRVEHFCSPQTARAMAMVAFERARQLGKGEESLAGVACTAALATDRPKRGPHRIHLALQTASLTTTWSLELEKGRRTRAEEEDVAQRLVLSLVAEALGLDGRLELDLADAEQLERHQTVAPRTWRELLLGSVESVVQGRPVFEAILSGSFNPMHVGHQQMAAIGEEILGLSVAMEMSIINVDKPPLDYSEIERRLGQFPPDRTVWLTRAATFEEKSRLFPGATFLVGVDTLRRIADPRYYGNDTAARQAALRRIVDRGCRFLVFGRDMGTGFVRLSDLELPEALQRICREISPERFREDVSSTELRRAGKW